MEISFKKDKLHFLESKETLLKPVTELVSFSCINKMIDFARFVPDRNITASRDFKELYCIMKFSFHFIKKKNLTYLFKNYSLSFKINSYLQFSTYFMIFSENLKN